MTYDILHSSFYREGSSNYEAQKTILDIVNNLPTIAENKHPCRKAILVVGGRQINKKFYVQDTGSFMHYMHAIFRICGLFTFNYDPSHYIDESSVALSELNDLDQVFPRNQLIEIFNLQAGKGFYINCTFSQFTAPLSHGCGDGRVEVKLFYRQQYISYTMCPNWGKRNFISVGIKVTLFMECYQRPLFLHIGDQHFTKLAFFYQILDFSKRSLKLYMYPFDYIGQGAELGIEYLLAMSNNDTFLTESLSNSALLYVAKFPNVLIYSFTFITSEFLTPVIFRRNVSCNIHGGETIFYDGPGQTLWQPVLPLLKHWSCSNVSDYSAGDSDQEAVRGSLGELNVIFFIPRKDTHESPYLTIAWHAERMLPGVLRMHKIALDVSAERMIYFHPIRSTSLEVVHIQAPKDKFVHLGFPEINYVLHPEMHFNRFFFEFCLDGFVIEDTLHHIWGEICFNSTAQNLLNHYRDDGLTVGQEIVITKKQYAWLATISGVITASVHSCAGYMNLLPHGGVSFFTPIKAPPLITITFDANMVYFENGTFNRYTNYRIILKRSPKACFKLQIVPFNALMFYELYLKELRYMHSYIKYTITSEDLTSPARFLIDFSSTGDILQFRNRSSIYGLRIYSLNHRYLIHSLPYTTVWDTEAYSAEIGLHSSIVTHAAGFKLQVSDGMSQPVCTYEHMPIEAGFRFDINLNGPCAYADLNAKEQVTVLIHKTYTNRRCCQFDGYIGTDHPQNEPNWLFLNSPWIGHTWNLSGSNTVAKFQVLCEASCEFIALHLERISLHILIIAYHANLLDQTYPIGITFEYIKIPFGSQPTLFTTWNQVCHNQHCYITPRHHMVTTWNEAQKACEHHRATLVSINSELEWNLLARLPQQQGKEFIEFYNIRSFIIFYIGLVTDVSTNKRRHQNKDEQLIRTNTFNKQRNTSKIAPQYHKRTLLRCHIFKILSRKSKNRDTDSIFQTFTSHEKQFKLFTASLNFSLLPNFYMASGLSEADFSSIMVTNEFSIFKLHRLNSQHMVLIYKKYHWAVYMYMG